MNTETITTTAQIITATTVAATAILPYTRNLPQVIIEIIKAISTLATKPRGRHTK